MVHGGWNGCGKFDCQSDGDESIRRVDEVSQTYLSFIVPLLWWMLDKGCMLRIMRRRPVANAVLCREVVHPYIMAVGGHVAQLIINWVGLLGLFLVAHTSRSRRSRRIE